ncbi:P-loop containing nucleoside triphosphate hydrolase protein [Phaeosphaeriaceae sp. PMI808]|nr:P-loop containing nucleoside triphosphate hydrolase protein [Phaeosphaeriaceae sp. PMI808]
MFSALRRCPSTLSRNLLTATVSSRAVQVPFFRSSSALRITSSRLAAINTAGFHHSAKWQQVAAAEADTEQAPESNEPIEKFSDLAKLGLVHPNIINVITKQMRLTTMTDVQIRTINEALSGNDVIAQAKTGTGKTLGFLIPIIQRIIQHDPNLAERARGYKRAKPDDIRAIIISPTRELAEQIAVEAKKVTSGSSIIVQTAVGGTQKKLMLQKTQREGCHLLIGTPGRLNDILSDPYSGVKAPKLNALVMDEADRLLDDGFQREIEEIRTHLPDPAEIERQNLMFSATVPRDVVALVRQTLRPGFHFAKCVDEDEEPTHQRVPQKFVKLTGFENIMPSLIELAAKQHKLANSGETRPFKAIIYYNSTSEVTLASAVFNKLSGGFKRNTPFTGLRSFEIHSKLSQMQRTRATDDFRRCKSGLLFSSDVTARGMDFPDVTHVIQIGLPRDRESYVHRIGRTGRAGKEGEGWLFITPVERDEVHRRLRGLPLTDATQDLECAQVDMSEEAPVSEEVSKILSDCVEAHKKVYPDQLDNAFRGLFGSFQWFGDKQFLIDAANRWAEFGWGMATPPPVPSSVYNSGGRRGGGRSRGGYGGGDRGYGGGDRGGAGSFGARREGGDRGGFNRNNFGGERRSGGYSDRRGGGDRGGFSDRREPRMNY